MAKHLRFVAVFLLVRQIGIAQNFVQNPGFETWANGRASAWISDSSAVAQSAAAHSGSYALKLQNYPFFGIPLPGTIYQATPVTGSTFSFKGWYQLKSDSGDGLYVSVTSSRTGQITGAGGMEFKESHSVYTAFAIGLAMFPDAASDSCFINITIAQDTSQASVHLGSYALIDDLVLDNTVTGVSKEDFAVPTASELVQNYPNPFNPRTTIEFTLASSEHVMLKVFNSLGQEVATLVDAALPQGRYRTSFDGTTLPSGLYFSELTAGKYRGTTKMMLIK